MSSEDPTPDTAPPPCSLLEQRLGGAAAQGFSILTEEMGKKQKGTGVEEGGAVFGVIQFNHLLTALAVLGSSFIWGWVF